MSIKLKKVVDRRGINWYNVKAVRNAAIAQQVERILGKDEVPSSNLGSSSTRNPVTAMVTGSFVIPTGIERSGKTDTKTATGTLFRGMKSLTATALSCRAVINRYLFIPITN